MDTIKKEITQNPERYSTKSDKYQISTSPDIKPLDLPFGESVEGLLPVLEVDGIIVNVGKYRLVSQRTLDTIKESNNPHYDIKSNGEVKGKKIGQTIPSITIDIQKLISVGAERDVLNRVAGVTDVNYIYEGGLIGETDITENLVKQINYTLNPDINRPEDEYLLAQLELSDEKNYDITALKITTKQSDEKIFDNTKLQEFLIGVKERMKALTTDFNTIKDIHFKGLIPNVWPTYKVVKMASAEDLQEEGDFTITYKNSELVSVEKTPTQKAQEQQQASANQLSTQLQQAVTAQQQALAGAQSADSRTQQYIQQQLDATRAQLQQVQKSLQK